MKKETYETILRALDSRAKVCDLGLKMAAVSGSLEKRIKEIRDWTRESKAIEEAKNDLMLNYRPAE